MPVEVRAPHFPESIEDGTLMTWHKQAGDAVTRDEKLAEIETDKVVLEVAAPADGHLVAILKKQGETVLDEEVLATVEAGAATTASEPAPAPPAPSGKPDPTPASEPAPVDRDPAMSPSVRKLITEHDLDAARLVGTGKSGRVTKADVLAALDEHTPPPPPAAPPRSDGRREERVPMSRLRARIAERLVDVQRETAMLTTFNEVNMKPVMDLRTRHKDAFEKEHGVKLGFMSFFVQASVGALKKFPSVNASIDGKDVVYHAYFDVGIAVSTERGLVVPILRDADQLSFADIESGIGAYAERARANQLTLDELSGGTFTITNGGIFGSLLSTPILNPPQSAILGMHRIQERPVAEDGEVVIRPMMYLALSYDHRIVDGREAVQFLVAIKEALEDPSRVLLQV